MVIDINQYNVLLSYAESKSIYMILIYIGSIGALTSKERCRQVLKSFGNVPVILITDSEKGYSCIRYDNFSGLSKGIKYLILNEKRMHIGMLTGYKNNGEKNYDKVLECLLDKDINVIKKSKQRIEIDELYNNEFMPKERKTYVMIDLYSRELQYGFIKQINDKYGHSEGNFAISTCASALDEVLREGMLEE